MTMTLLLIQLIFMTECSVGRSTFCDYIARRYECWLQCNTEDEERTR